MPQREPGLEADVLPRSYRDVVGVLQDAVHPMRAHHLCATLGLSTDKNKVEGFRSKLKRLVERGWPAEGEPGLFAWGGARRAGAGAPEQEAAADERRRAGVGHSPRRMNRARPSSKRAPGSWGDCSCRSISSGGPATRRTTCPPSIRMSGLRRPAAGAGRRRAIIGNWPPCWGR
ncbi:hypothetical protein JS756_32370 [Streptomyces actuosus]|uniref:Uncharacterized protein n=1 Tax=Streptomyces actuosus TaxID=1885 RepID=A0ABS2W096_STRAS|nr:hypothetical protein [Streptomyces actuosus]MBN0048704.1 hypothetical protein [Streptomyces actuosus]